MLLYHEKNITKKEIQCNDFVVAKTMSCNLLARL